MISVFDIQRKIVMILSHFSKDNKLFLFREELDLMPKEFFKNVQTNLILYLFKKIFAQGIQNGCLVK